MITKELEARIVRLEEQDRLQRDKDIRDSIEKGEQVDTSELTQDSKSKRMSLRPD